LKGCLEGGHEKKGAKDIECGNATAPTDDAMPTNAKGKKMIRDPITLYVFKPLTSSLRNIFLHHQTIGIVLIRNKKYLIVTTLLSRYGSINQSVD
jgi:hypothetical protein